MRFNATWTGTAVRKQNGLVMQLVECKTENTVYIPDHEIVPLQLLGCNLSASNFQSLWWRAKTEPNPYSGKPTSTGFFQTRDDGSSMRSGPPLAADSDERNYNRRVLITDSAAYDSGSVRCS